MEYRLNNFEGPLDLLLHLINKARIEPKDIFVSEITEQYLEYMSQTDEIDMEAASDFLQMAATLIYIKSRSLLPLKRRDDDMDEDGLTPEEQLIRQLNEYKRYKEIAESLRGLEEAGKKDFYKLPEEPCEEVGEVRIVGADAALLMRAYLKALETVRRNTAPKSDVIILKDSFSIKKQINTVMARLTLVDEANFFDIMSKEPTREEVAVTFLALLELLHMGRIHVLQKKTCGDIFIKKIADADRSLDLPGNEDD